MPYRHLILFRIRDGTSRALIDHAKQGLESLHDSPGVIEWRIEESLDRRKGTVLIEETTFASKEALDAFRESPRHREVASLLTQIADWLVGDYEA